MDFDIESVNNIDGVKGCSVASMDEWVENDIS